MMEISADDLRPKDKEQVEAYFEQLDDEQGKKDSPRKLLRHSLGRASKRFEAAKKKRKEDRSQRNRRHREVRRLSSENKRIEASIKLANTRNENLKDKVRRQKIEFHRQKQELGDHLRRLKIEIRVKERHNGTTKNNTETTSIIPAPQYSPAVRVDFSGQIWPNGNADINRPDLPESISYATAPSSDMHSANRIDDAPAVSNHLSDESKPLGVTAADAEYQTTEEDFPTKQQNLKSSHSSAEKTCEKMYHYPLCHKKQEKLLSILFSDVLVFQELLPTCISNHHKDTYGSNRMIPFQSLWDVDHWNSFFPKLPRMVHYNATLFPQFNPKRHSYRCGKCDRPYQFGKQKNTLGLYMRYAKGNTQYAVDGHRNPAEVLMFQGALRPHAKIQALIDEKLKLLLGGPTSHSNNHTQSGYMTIHARVEPDMQRHMVCRDRKVTNLTQIFEFLQDRFPEPPVSRLFLPIHRALLKKEANQGPLPPIRNRNSNSNSNSNNSQPQQQEMASYRLAYANFVALQHASAHGLWGGRVQVHEFGAESLQGTEFESRKSTIGSMLNFFLSLHAKIFVGTEVSSYSHDIVATRFYRGNMENYKYLPDGLHLWTPDNLTDPPGFRC